ncbi:MAG: hypothetical protein JWN70_4122 [Planctomycetaceae bacterium]|nr:hypothetical protein [Planctomycetaceae bacterium]
MHSLALRACIRLRPRFGGAQGIRDGSRSPNASVMCVDFGRFVGSQHRGFRDVSRFMRELDGVIERTSFVLCQWSLRNVGTGRLLFVQRSLRLMSGVANVNIRTKNSTRIRQEFGTANWSVRWALLPVCMGGKVGDGQECPSYGRMVTPLASRILTVYIRSKNSKNAKTSRVDDGRCPTLINRV